MNTINVGIADDHLLFREGIRLILDRDPQVQLILEASNGQELIDAIEQGNQPDVVLVDLKMPVKDGMETTRELKANFPEIKILILTMMDQDDYILHLLDIGANGYLLKNSDAQVVVKAIHNVAQNGFYFSDQVSQVMLAGLKRKRKTPPALTGDTRLTEREREVLELICKEYTTADMAEKLFVSERTIETHRKNLMEKLGAKNTAGIVYRAMKEGVLE
ncbi:MAG: response regulator [Salibacteraceae bacterium]